MKNFLILSLILAASSFIFFSFTNETNTADNELVKWYTWEEAVAANKENPKKIFVDFYTDWCGWCKRMDKTTFSDPKVAKYINENFYAVKFDAEQKEDIVYEDKTFKFVPSGRRGVHELAYSLLEGKLGYPSAVYLSEDMERIMTSPGYKDPNGMMKELTFAAEDHYKDTSWQIYQKQ